jgi:hypothetical protein
MATFSTPTLNMMGSALMFLGAINAIINQHEIMINQKKKL